MKLTDTVMFACNQGGHFSQMLELKELFPKFHSVLVTDNEWAKKGLPELKNLDSIEFAMGMADNRKKNGGKQENGIMSRASGYLAQWKQCVEIWLKYKPKIIISTGSNIAVPLFYFGKLFGSKLIYIESRAKVTSKNVTGKLVAPISDKVIVQWPEMKEVYGKKAEYYGILA